MYKVSDLSRACPVPLSWNPHGEQGGRGAGRHAPSPNSWRLTAPHGRSPGRARRYAVLPAGGGDAPTGAGEAALSGAGGAGGGGRSRSTVPLALPHGAPADDTGMEQLAGVVARLFAQPNAKKIATAIVLVGVAVLVRVMPRPLRDKILEKVGLKTPVDKSVWPLDAWVHKRCEEAIDPDMEIIDPHHHLWDPRSQPKGWGIPQWQIQAFYQMLSPADLAEHVKGDTIKRGQQAVLNSFGWRQIPFIQPYMGPELLLDIRNRDRGARGHNVVKTVYLECGWPDDTVEEALRPIGEVKMVESVNADHPTLCNGMVAYANLSLADVEKTLQGLSEHKIVRGIRHALAWTSDEGIAGAGNEIKEDTASTPEFRRGFAMLEKYGLSYDVWAFHEQLGQLADLARAFPSQVIILDHVAEPLGICTYTQNGTWPKWKAGIEDLAKASENVHVKLSGLAMCRTGFRHDELDTPPTSEVLARDWGPYFRAVLDAFGVRRCMFASNFPVDKASTDYTVMWNAFKLIAKDYTAEEKRLLFYENAARVYRL